jgi:endonuclease YncB( thermonuclease family)
LIRVFLATLWVVVLTASAIAEPISPGEIEVTDGDTIIARGHEYRLVGFDTPEFWSRSRKVPLKERRLALFAAERLQELIEGGELTLSEIQCACPDRAIGTKRCNWGRKCAILAVNGKDVAATLIAEGHAREYVCSRTKCPVRRPWIQ